MKWFIQSNYFALTAKYPEPGLKSAANCNFPSPNSRWSTGRHPLRTGLEKTDRGLKPRAETVPGRKTLAIELFPHRLISFNPTARRRKVSNHATLE
jgi:hypothetical protein